MATKADNNVNNKVITGEATSINCCASSSANTSASSCASVNASRDANISVNTNAFFSNIAQQYDKFNAISSFGIYRHWLRVLVDAAEWAVRSKTPDTQYANSPLREAPNSQFSILNSQLREALNSPLREAPNPSLREAPNSTPPRIIDIAGGTGEVSFAIAKRLPAAQITLIDCCQPMLDVAAKRIISGSVSRAVAANISLKLADAQSLPYPNNSFDLATCAYGIRNIPNRQLALSEAYRVLKPGGSLLVCEFSTPPAKFWRQLYHIWLGTAIPLIGTALTGDSKEFCYLRDSIRQFPAQLDFCEMLFTAGFANISYRNLTGGIVALHKAIK